MNSELALPRDNGELVFQAPWESRVFGLAVALHRGGAYAWGEFSANLAAEIAHADAAGDPERYYERWLAAFEELLLSRGLVDQAELTRELAIQAARDDHQDH